MSPDPNYPRMMFHPRLDPVIVYSEDEEAALGPDWSRRLFPALYREEKPEEPAPPAKPRRGRPAADQRE